MLGRVRLGETDPGGAAEVLVVTRYRPHLGEAGHRPHLVAFEEDHWTGVPEPGVERLWITLEVVSARIEIQLREVMGVWQCL
jgi:hypothetical protein